MMEAFEASDCKCCGDELPSSAWHSICDYCLDACIHGFGCQKLRAALEDGTANG